MFCLRQRYQFYCLNKTTFHPCLTPKVDETVLTREWCQDICNAIQSLTHHYPTHHLKTFLAERQVFICMPSIKETKVHMALNQQEESCTC